MKRNRLQRLICLVCAAACILILASCQKDTPTQKTDMLAYCASDGLHLCSLDGSGDRLVAKGEHIGRVFFSEDGRYLVYNNSNDVFLYDSETGSSSFLAANSRCVGLTQGRFLILTRAQGVLLSDPASGELTTVVPQPEEGYIAAVCPSPDEVTRYAYTVCYTDAGREYYKAFCITSPGSDDSLSYTPYEICGNSGGMPLPLFWSANGSTVVFSCPAYPGAPDMLYSVAIADSSPSRLAGAKSLQLENGGLLSFSVSAALSVSKISAQGGYIAFIDRSDLSVSLLPAEPSIDGLSISPDGNSAAYSCDGSVYICSSSRTLFICGGGYTSPSFSPDGMYIYSVLPGEEVSLCRSNANSAGATVIVSGLRAPDPDYGEEYADLFDFFYVKDSSLQ